MLSTDNKLQGTTMKINHFLQLIILFLCILWHNACYATPLSIDEAKKWAQNKGEEIIDILVSEEAKQKQERLNYIMEHDIDIEHAKKFAIGKYWRTMNEEQKARYDTAFKNYIKSAYQSYDLDIKKGDVTFAINKAEQNEKTVDVFCTIIIKNIEQNVDEASKGGINVVFALVKNDGIIQVQDFKIEESSLLISLRQRFYKMIHEDDDDEIDWFLDDLESASPDDIINNSPDF